MTDVQPVLSAASLDFRPVSEVPDLQGECALMRFGLNLRLHWPEADIATKHPARSKGRRPPGESQTAPRAGFWAKLGASLGCRAMVAAINRAELRSRSPSRGLAFARLCALWQVRSRPIMPQVQTETL